MDDRPSDDDPLFLTPTDVVAHFRERGLSISAAMVERWQLHAKAYLVRKPFLSEHRRPLPALDRYIVLDLEYDPSAEIWLTGAALVEGNAVTYTHWWADTPEQERQAILGLARFLEANPEVAVVTWNGLSADLPRLAARATHLGVEGVMESLIERHVDLYQWAQFSLRLPIPSLGLKNLSEAVGFAKLSPISSGLEALMFYWQYKKTSDPKLREQLTDYNRDDLDALVFVVNALRRLVEKYEGTALSGKAV